MKSLQAVFSYWTVGLQLWRKASIWSFTKIWLNCINCQLFLICCHIPNWVKSLALRNYRTPSWVPLWTRRQHTWKQKENKRLFSLAPNYNPKMSCKIEYLVIREWDCIKYGLMNWFIPDFFSFSWYMRGDRPRRERKSGKQVLVSFFKRYPGQVLFARSYQLLFHLAWFFSLCLASQRGSSSLSSHHFCQRSAPFLCPHLPAG